MKLIIALHFLVSLLIIVMHEARAQDPIAFASMCRSDGIVVAGAASGRPTGQAAAGY